MDDRADASAGLPRHGRAMESYVVRIYRRVGRKSRILIGTVEAAGTGRRMAFSNIEELWDILTRRRFRQSRAPTPSGRLAGKEVMGATATPDQKESADGRRPMKPASGA